MQRFFVSFPLSIDLELTDSDIVHQLSRVLRSREGDHIVLFDGDGSESEYEITKIDKKSISLRGVSRSFPKTEYPKKVSLYQAIPNKYEKLEYILQKGVEVGIQEFVFFRSDRSQKLVLSSVKIARFHLIAREAVEQCGGVVMPRIEFVEKLAEQDFSSSLQKQATLSKGQIANIVLDTVGKSSKISDYSHFGDINLWIGPEGGWSDTERAKMVENGFIFARFGERVFRTETAGVVVAFGLLNS